MSFIYKPGLAWSLAEYSMETIRALLSEIARQVDTEYVDVVGGELLLIGPDRISAAHISDSAKVVAQYRNMGGSLPYSAVPSFFDDYAIFFPGLRADINSIAISDQVIQSRFVANLDTMLEALVEYCASGEAAQNEYCDMGEVLLPEFRFCKQYSFPLFFKY